MLNDSQRYESKRVEIETWLHRMEGRAERMGTIAITADILDAQQKEQKVRDIPLIKLREVGTCPANYPSYFQSFHAELHQFKHQIELFNSLTQKLIAVYPTDDTSRIKRMTESVNNR